MIQQNYIVKNIIFEKLLKNILKKEEENILIKTMNSTKQLTQKRMLNLPNQVNSPRLAKIAARSPTNTNNLSPTHKSIKTLFKNFQLPKHEQIKFTQSVKTIQNHEQLHQKIHSNYDKQTLTFENGDQYEGSIRNNKMFGKGTYFFAKDRLQYTGQFYQNTLNGWGVLKRKSNTTQILFYEGNFSSNKKHGQGKYLYDGQTHYYNGEWKYDKKEGKGVYFFKEGLYNGQWSNNLMHGEGSVKLNNGLEYKGQFENGNFVRGLIRYPNGDEYSGSVSNGQRHGQGSYFNMKSQERYKGQWMNDKKNGKGITYLQNGDQFQSTFYQGQIDETQSCTYKWISGPDSGSIFNGWFKDGKPEKGHIIKGNGQQFDIY